MISSKKYYSIYFLASLFLLSACSVGNKVIPDNTGNAQVDTTNTTLNAFTIFVTGDTTFTMNIVSADSLNIVNNDSLIVAGIELNGSALAGLAGFKTFSDTVGNYLVESSPPGITKAEFGIIKTINGVRKLFPMNHGSITITSHNVATKEVKGSFDVNNEFIVPPAMHLVCKGHFYIKYQ